MAGTIRAVIDGKTYTAENNYHMAQHSGAAEDTRAFTPDFALRAFQTAGLRPEELEGGDVTVVVDGTLVHRGMGHFPESETGSADQGGFGFGGLDAGLDILNYGRTAQRQFTVQKVGENQYGGEWRTTVDGDVVETGTTRPFQITWNENAGNQRGFL